ncbi:hypothetical protein EVAR_77757_1 [Eumeta japonica]|uniref:Uncharacterized protein n=1 Tax=Eumeta variegata TaxID=151549 RepID=A0A4C1TDV4_EUMVA|nr:hypothetical protein EVAR_77757_1 [Eumeta japonica]
MELGTPESQTRPKDFFSVKNEHDPSPSARLRTPTGSFDFVHPTVVRAVVDGPAKTWQATRYVPLNILYVAVGGRGGHEGHDPSRLCLTTVIELGPVLTESRMYDPLRLLSGSRLDRLLSLITVCDREKEWNSAFFSMSNGGPIGDREPGRSIWYAHKSVYLAHDHFHGKYVKCMATPPHLYCMQFIFEDGCVIYKLQPFWSIRQSLSGLRSERSRYSAP